MSEYYLDCEFDGHNGPLLSMALVCDDGRSVHYRIADAPEPSSKWVAENVLPAMRKHLAQQSMSIPAVMLGDFLREFIGDDERPQIIADSPVDIARFCSAISTNLSGEWEGVSYPRMSFEAFDIDSYPTSLPGAVQHNAWWDAMALKHALEPTQ